MILSDMKIYVVVIVLMVIFLGIATLLFFIERKLDKFEKKIDDIESEIKQNDKSD